MALSEITRIKTGILGGGQLGKMLCQAGSRLGLHLYILENNPECPAAAVCPKITIGDITLYDDVVNFGKDKDVITIEIENINTDALYELEARGVKVYPQPKVLEIIKDKGLQKNYYQANDFPTSPFRLFADAGEIQRAIVDGDLQYPFVQKSRTEGYDGRGVSVIRSEKDLDFLLDTASVVEDLVHIDKEISVIIARNDSGQLKSFPVVEMDFHPTANLVENLFCPSQLDEESLREASNIAGALAEKLGIVGLLAVEMFMDTSGHILINEIAPRPHNSGHHTIEACVTSQYEQHLRAILNLPLGDTTLIRPAVMVNLLGEPNYAGKAVYQGLNEILNISGVYPHIYGKKETRPYRKMGHVTVTAEHIEEARRKAEFVRKTFKVTA
jgi:5-(carboxyamino)imidazole ribonucleotide synthase